MKNDMFIKITPIIKIKYKYKNLERSIFAKLEFFNISGSIKDRIAYYIINNAKKRNELKEKMPIIDATSGNTGISLAALGSYYKHPIYIFMPDWASKERIAIMKSYGAKIFLISKEEGGFKKCINEAKKLSKQINGFYSNQFSNKDNVLAHYETTGKEILEQIPEKIGGFVSGVGTGGTIMGIGTRLKENNKNTLIVAIEPDNMPIISGKKIKGYHKIEGIGDDFLPDLLDKEKLDDVILINDKDAINMSRKLARELGLGVGISSGANFLGSVILKNQINEAVVTIFADDNKKYMSTELSETIDFNKSFISNQVELINYEIL